MKKFASLLVLLGLLVATSTDAQTAYDKGNAAYGARNFNDAAFHFGRAEPETPGNMDLQVKLANCYRYMNKMIEAQKRYAIVCSTPGTAPINYYNYGQVLEANKQYDKALEQYAKYAQYNKVQAEKARASVLFAKKNLTTPSAFTVRKETAISHASFDDYAPVLHKGKLLFTSARKININSGVSASTNNYIYQANRAANGGLSQPVLIKSPIEIAPQTNLSPFAVNAEETMAVTTFNQFDNGVRHIYEASFINTGMELSSTKHGMKNLSYIPIGEPFPNIGEQYAASFPALADNGKSIYFAAYNLPGGYGGFDLWVIYKQGTGWTQPQNLGPNVNTSGDEISPNIATNGQLYFSSNYHKGFGGQDVFRAVKQGGVWKEVRNLGNKVNSSFDDQYFVYDAVKRAGYFASNREGYYNIYYAQFTGKDAQLPLVNESERAVAVVEPVVPPNNNNRTPTNNGRGKLDVNTPNNGSVNNKGVVYVTPSENTNLPKSTVVTTPSGGFRPQVSPNTNVTNTPPAPVPPVNVSDKPTINPDDPANTIPCAMNFYIGAVVDKTNQRPIKDALIYIKNQKTGEEKRIKDPTNHYGEYSVILKPLHDYTIVVSKPGFENLIFDINTGSGGKKTLLGTRELVPTATVQRDKYGNAVLPDLPSTPDKTPTADDLVNPVRSSGKTFSYDANGMELPETGYLIQAVVTKDFTPEERANLEQYGNVITEKRGDATAYRVGIFASPVHSDQALANIRQTYPDAFKVPVKLNKDKLGDRLALGSQVIYPLPAPKPMDFQGATALPKNPPVVDRTPADVPPSTSQSTPPPIKEEPMANWTTNAPNATPPGTTGRGIEPVAPTTPSVVFKVQLGAFKDAKSINFKSLEHLGQIEKRTKANGLTYIYLSSFKTIEDARVARTKVKESGKVPAPFIIAFKNGVQVNLSEVMN